MKRISKIIGLFAAVLILLQTLPVLAWNHFEEYSTVASQKRFSAMCVDETTDIAYISDDETDIKVFDFSSPKHIKQIGSIATNEKYTSMGVYSNYLYAVADGKARIDIFNVADSSKLLLVGKISSPGVNRIEIINDDLYVASPNALSKYSLRKSYMGMLTASVATEGNIPCIGFGETYTCYTSYSGRVKILSSENFEVLGTVDIPADYPLGCTIYNNTLYVANSNSGNKKILQVDISNPEKPVLASQYDTVTAFFKVKVMNNTLYAMGWPRRPMQKFSVDSKGYITEMDTVWSMKSASDCYSDGTYDIILSGSALLVYDSTFEVTHDMLPRLKTEKEISRGFKSKFTDISGSECEEAVINLEKTDIISGIDDTHFGPDKNVTLAEFLTSLEKALNYMLKAYQKGKFIDVKPCDSYADVIQTAVDKGLLDSYFIKDEKIKPTRELTYEEMAAIYIKACILEGELSDELEFKSEDGKLSEDYMKYAQSLGIFENVSAAETVTRDKFAISLNNFYNLIYHTPEFKEDGKYPVSENKAVSFTQLLVKDSETVVCDGSSWKQEPAIIRITDAVEPGELFNLYGEGFTKNTAVYAEKVTASQYPDAPSENAVKCKIHEIDSEGQFVITQLPKEVQPGAYVIWAENEYGYSRPKFMNAVRVDWIDRKEALYNVPFKVLGKNLCAKEFGGEMASGVALVNGDTSYDLKIESINPYCIEAVVPESVPVGRYTVAVTNDGNVWDVANDLTDGITEIEVAGNVTDPLNLKMAWANRFVWDNVIDVTKAPYNVARDGMTDCSAAVQKAIDDAKAAGGGMVYLPKGVYKIKHIALPSKVTLVGDGMENTTILYINNDPEDKRVLIDTKDDGATDGIIGIADFTIKVPEGNMIPRAFVWLGEVWGDNYYSRSLRTAKYIFMKGIRQDIPVDLPDDKAAKGGSGAILFADSDVLAEDNIFYGRTSGITSTNIGTYAYFINNHLTISSGHIFAIASKTVYEHNVFNFINDLVEHSYSQGLFCRSYAYAYRNSFKNQGEIDETTGEVICAESYMGETRMVGNVASCAGNTVSAVPTDGAADFLCGKSFLNVDYWDINNGQSYDSCYILITKGRGLGQYRKVVAADKEKREITIDTPWDIQPGPGSRFVLTSLIVGDLWYNNSSYHTLEGLSLYGNCVDCVVAGNREVDGSGTSMRSFIQRPSETTAQVVPSYFNRIADNEFLGVSKVAEGNNIRIHAETFEPTDASIFCYIAYGIDIKNNVLNDEGRPLRNNMDTWGEPGWPGRGILILGFTQDNLAGKKNYKGVIVEKNNVKMNAPCMEVYDIEGGSSGYGMAVYDNDFESPEESIIDNDKVITYIQD